jgi:cell division protein FtsB
VGSPDGRSSTRAWARASSGASSRPPAASRAERQRAARTRRNRLVLAVAVVASAAIVGAWFPVSALLHQREQLTAAAAQLHRLDGQNAALRHQEKQLRTPTTLGRIAQEQYDLVPPGDQAYQVLPPSGSGSSDGALAPTGARATGESGPGSSRASSSGSAGATAGGFFRRVLQTLEFWR